MKKILLAIAILCFAAAANAQTEFRYGFKGGLNFSTFSTDPDDVQARMGQWGVLCRFRVGSFAVQPELFYARQGVRSLERMIQRHPDHAYQTGEWDHDELYKLMLLTDNIQMPIMIKYYLPIFDGLNIQAGPQMSQRFDYKISSPSQKGYLLDPKIDGTGDIRDYARDMNHFSVAANVGVGYDSASGIGVDFRCSLGLTPVFKTLYNTHSRDRVWSISFTYTL